MRSKVLFIIIASAVALTLAASAASTAHAQDQLEDRLILPRTEATITPIEPERPREFTSFRFERNDGESLVTAGDHRFGHRRDRDESPDGRNTRFERILFAEDEHSSVRWSFWRSGDRQDFHGGTKFKAFGIALSIVY